MAVRQGFIDWMKAVGMALIVFGHFFGDPFNQFTQPVYPKQLGVCFFVFAMGWSLANDRRSTWLVVYNRLFPMYFWGAVIAILLTIIGLIVSAGPQISNYAPFVAGVNVLFNQFPANPTTWFIGTYLHILLIWALWLQHRKVTVSMILVCLIFELTIRGCFIYADRLMTGYMLLPNWGTVLLLGMLFHDKGDSLKPQAALWLIPLWAVFTIGWAIGFNAIGLQRDFPFKVLHDERTLIEAAFISIAVSAVYIIQTMFAFVIFRCLNAGVLVRFFARNTIITFIGHMPLYYAVAPIATLLVERGWGKRAIIVVVMYVGLSLLSEALHKLLPINQWRDALWTRLGRRHVGEVSP